MLTTSWDFRLLWTLLPLQTRLFLLCLFAAAIYSGISLVKTFIRILKLSGNMPAAGAETLYRRLSVRLHNLRQLHFLFLLLFGLFLTDEAFRTALSFKQAQMMLAVPTIAELLDPLLGFAFLSLLVLTTLHSLQ
jgi:hypothetical protein